MTTTLIADKYQFLSAIETYEARVKKRQSLTHTRHDNNDRRYKGFNLLDEADASLFRLLLEDQFVIQGFSNKLLRQHLTGKKFQSNYPVIETPAGSRPD